MVPNRRFLASIYLVLSLLVVIPMAETVVSVMPLRPGEVTWRFGAGGMVSRALMTALFGLVAIGGLAFILGHGRVLRSVAVAAWLGVLFLVAASALFVLDSIQVRANVRLDARSSFDVAALFALAKAALAVLILALLASGAWAAAGRFRVPSRAPLVYGRARLPDRADSERQTTLQPGQVTQ